MVAGARQGGQTSDRCNLRRKLPFLVMSSAPGDVKGWLGLAESPEPENRLDSFVRQCEPLNRNLQTAYSICVLQLSQF